MSLSPYSAQLENALTTLGPVNPEYPMVGYSFHPAKRQFGLLIKRPPVPSSYDRMSPARPKWECVYYDPKGD